jgi:hypothetical protein
MESHIRDLRYSAAFRAKELEKRIAHLENLVGWLTGLLIDLVAIAFGVAAAIFVEFSGWRSGLCLFSSDVLREFHLSESRVMVFPRPASRGTELIPPVQTPVRWPMGTAPPSAVPFLGGDRSSTTGGHSIRVHSSLGCPSQRVGTSQAILLFGDQDTGKLCATIWSAIVLVLVAVITAVWIGVLGFGLMHLVEYAI